MPLFAESVEAPEESSVLNASRPWLSSEVPPCNVPTPCTSMGAFSFQLGCAVQKLPVRASQVLETVQKRLNPFACLGKYGGLLIQKIHTA